MDGLKSALEGAQSPRWTASSTVLNGDDAALVRMGLDADVVELGLQLKVKIGIRIR